MGQRNNITFAFPIFLTQERKKKGKRDSKLLYSILGVQPFGIRRAKSESSFTRRGLCVETKKEEGFHRRSK